MNSEIKDLSKTAGNVFPFVPIVEENDKKVLGMLFISEITAVKPKYESDNLGVTLKDFLNDNKIEDFIPKTRWTLIINYYICV